MTFFPARSQCGTLVLISRTGEERREYVKPNREIQKADSLAVSAFCFLTFENRFAIMSLPFDWLPPSTCQRHFLSGKSRTCPADVGHAPITDPPRDRRVSAFCSRSCVRDWGEFPRPESPTARHYRAGTPCRPWQDFYIVVNSGHDQYQSPSRKW